MLISHIPVPPLLARIVTTLQDLAGDQMDAESNFTVIFIIKLNLIILNLNYICNKKKDPPATVPSAALADIQGNGKNAIVAPFSDGTIRAIAYNGNQIFSFSYASDLGKNNQNEAIEA